MNVMESLAEVFREVFADASIQLTAKTTADDIEGWDSLSHVNLIIAVEMKFGIEFSQKEIRSFSNVGELTACVEGKLPA